MTRITSIGLGITLLVCVWLYHSLDQEQTACRLALDDNARLRISNDAKSKTILRQQNEVLGVYALLAARDSLSAGTINDAQQAETALMELKSETIDIDLAFPSIVSDPLYLLYSQTYNRLSTGVGAGTAPALPISSQTGSSPAQTNEHTHLIKMDSTVAHLGQRNGD